MSLSVRAYYLLPLLICSCYLPSHTYPSLSQTKCGDHWLIARSLDQIQHFEVKLFHPCCNDSRWPQETEKNTIIQHMRTVRSSLLYVSRWYYMSRNNCGCRFVKCVAHSEMKLFLYQFYFRLCDGLYTSMLNQDACTSLSFCRAMLRRARLCYGKSSFRPSVCPSRSMDV